MKLTPKTTLAAAVVIAIGGFAIGRISAPAGAEEAGVALAEERGPSARSAARGGDGRAVGAARQTRTNNRPDARAGGRDGDRLERLASIVRGENALDRGRAMLSFIDQLGPDDMEEAVAHFRSLGITDSRFGEYAMLLTAWAEMDPMAALSYATANTGGSFATTTILTAWAGRDPEAAVAWAAQNHTGDGANPHMPGIIQGIAASDPLRATQLLTEMPFSRERGAALAAMLPHLIRQGPDAARIWVAGLEDERLRDGAMVRLAEQLASVDPKGTAEWLVANPGAAADQRLNNVFDAWARQDQAGAIASFNSLPPGAARSNAFRGVVSAVAASDPQAAAAMLNRHSGDVTDGAVRSFVWHSFGSDPVTAANHINMISDAGARDEMYRRTLTGWLRRDPDTATSWIRSNAVPPTVLEQMSGQLEEARQRQQ